MSSDEATLIIPSPAHIALAIITVRSKPAHISITDYLTMLSNSVNQQGQDVTSCEPRIDAAKFWKQAYERAEREKAQLQEYVHRFESDRLDASNNQSTSPRKRKAEHDQPVRANTQSKRRELDSPLRHNEIDLNAGDDSNDGVRGVLREIFQLRCLLRSTTPPSHQLCLRTGSICQAVEVIFASTVSPRKGTSQNHPDRRTIADLATIFTACYPSMLQALDHATNHDAPDNDLTIANGSIVQLFQVALGELHKAALDQVTMLEEEAQSKRNKPKQNIKAGKTESKEAENILESASKAVVQMLVTMLTSIDCSKDSHCELLEGLLCALLDHIGSSLSLMIFADPETSNENIGIEPPCGLTHVSHIKTKAALTAAEIEGPYLIEVLRNGLHFIRDNQQKMSKYMQEIFSWTEHKDITDPAVLRAKIEARLQGTLLRGVFGDDDRTFDNALRREHPLEQADIDAITTGVKDPEQDRSTRFIGQMWEQLGWEILSGRAKRVEMDSA